MKYFSMFSGIGGFELGIQQSYETNNRSEIIEQKVRLNEASVSPERNIGGTFSINGNGWGLCPQCVGYSEIDKYAIQIFERHFPNIKNYGDCTKIIASELPDFDLLCGGFPCQAFSIAGKRLGFNDTRGTLFFDIARIVKEKRPKYLLLENVKGLLSHDNGRTFKTIITTLAELGYDLQWQVLNSKNFGVPQNRERVFIIGHLRGKPRPKVFPIGESNEVVDTKSKIANTLTSNYYKGAAASRPMIGELQYVGAVMSPKNSKWLEDGKIHSRNFPQGQRVYSEDGIASTIAGNAGGQGGKTGLYAVLTPDRPKKRQHGRRFKENGEPSFTLTGQDIHGISDGTKIRRLTPTECERLQGFPDGWTERVSDTQRYRQLGNAVTTNVVKIIIQKMFYEQEKNTNR